MAQAIPLILTIATAGASVIGGVMGMQAARADAKALQEQAAYNAAVARNQATLDEHNARLAELDADTARENMGEAGWASQVSAFDQDMQAKQEIALERAAISTSGLTGGSLSRRIESLQVLAARDRERLRRIGDNEVAGFRQQESDLLVEAQNTRQGAKSLRTDAQMMRRNAAVGAQQARISGTASLISGFSGAAGSLLDGSRSPSVRRQFSNLRSSFSRRAT